MGGRYGASSDGSSDYQSRRPNGSDRDPEQQTVAEAVRNVRRRQRGSAREGRSNGPSAERAEANQTDSGTGRRGIGLEAATRRIVSTTVAVDKHVADVVASSIVTQIQHADDQILEEDDEWLV